MGGSDYKFRGWLGFDPRAVEGNLKFQEYEPKPWSETDVDIRVECCGICGSDIHTLRSGWKPTDYPVCVGHEIVGIAVRVGSKAEGGIKVGDRVGVGAQSSSCLKPDCEECSNGNEQYCAKMVGTYDSRYEDGGKSYGGYSDYARVPSHFVIKIPGAIPPEEAAPMLCGGVTLFSPLKRNACGPGKKVGIVGLGGLGHFGVLFAKALGADEVVIISRTNGKKQDAMKMGATGFIATEEKGWEKRNGRTLDLIVSTVSSPDMPLGKYLQLLRTGGQFIQVGAPEDRIPGFNAFSLISKGVKFGGSCIGSPAELREMLDLAAEKGIHPWINKRPLRDVNKVVPDMVDGKARYRYVLVNESHAKL